MSPQSTPEHNPREHEIIASNPLMTMDETADQSLNHKHRVTGMIHAAHNQQTL